ncbi:putative transcriptional regulator [Fluviicoccus keumensis]|uniref:Putative transcriptional regulator n=1 Tax=Fluviicoccus keumensis TaxID=1435465 RepID=A0A4Q7ZBV7_9GAMM|nr:ribbon-helix-helix domain-containing protein [Fluviicoccus keumensis]RZU48098.1 putative transcriptional regulator [Fluviicoccus keumensis]
MSTTISMRVDDELVHQLDLLATSMGRSRSYVVSEAIQAYVREQAWQVKEIQEALREADAGDFADAAEVNAVLSKWSAHAG